MDEEEEGEADEVAGGYMRCVGLKLPFRGGCGSGGSKDGAGGGGAGLAFGLQICSTILDLCAPIISRKTLILLPILVV